MSEVRFRIQTVRPGTSAKQAEDLSRGASHSNDGRTLRVQAGSAARMAEEAKRADAGTPARAVGFSLRAGGGRVERRPVPEVPSFTERDATYPEARVQGAPNGPSLSAAPSAAAAEGGTAASTLAGPVQTVVDRLKSIFRVPGQPGRSA